jgi:hypothetical protein
MQQTIFATFLVVQHKLHGDARTIWPTGIWRRCTMSGEITRVAGGIRFCIHIILLRLVRPVVKLREQTKQARKGFAVSIERN